MSAKRIYEEGSDPHHAHWMVYDADDPERGYFNEVEDAE